MSTLLDLEPRFYPVDSLRVNMLTLLAPEPTDEGILFGMNLIITGELPSADLEVVDLNNPATQKRLNDAVRLLASVYITGDRDGQPVYRS